MWEIFKKALKRRKPNFIDFVAYGRHTFNIPTYKIIATCIERALPRFGLIITSKVTRPQDAHKMLILQVYLGLNTLEFTAVRR